MGTDKDAESVVDRLTEEAKNKSKGKTQNRLKVSGLSARPIDHADDDGVGWRDMMKPFLKKKECLF